MACNENIVKNIANEITRNCQAQNVTVDAEFVVYLVDLLLLNPKYGKLFSKTINRSNLQYFVEECVQILTRGDTSLNTLRIQHIIQTNYDKLQNLIEKHLQSISACLRPLVSEILDAEPAPDDEAECRKLFRKISIYIVLASGLGNPGVITTLKEGMAALESVFSLDDLKIFVAIPRTEKMAQLEELTEIVSGVRLFNRDCKKGGEGIPDLPFNLVDAGKACLGSLSNALIAVMQRVNALTTAVADAVSVHHETGNVYVDIPSESQLTLEDYKQIFQLLAFNRQYELFVRKLLADVETMVENSITCVDRAKGILEELHAAVKYKAAVPVITVFPLFTRLWQVWRSMQNIMFLVSTVNRLMSTLAAIQDQMKMPSHILDAMLKGKKVVTDQDRMTAPISVEERLSLGSLRNYVANDFGSSSTAKDVQLLGFCALCVGSGALVPGAARVGHVKHRARLYAFCSVPMALRFTADPDRYVNEVLHYARNNPHVINLLGILEDVYRVKDVEVLVTEHVPKTKVMDKDIQTEMHPVESYIEKNYSWDMWKWKRRACQWATIVKCKTHSTQTIYSHLRSEIQCQTVEPRDKCLQTKQDSGVNTPSRNYFLWGLRGQMGYGQHTMDLTDYGQSEKKKARAISTCTWPCLEPNAESSTSISERQHKL